MASSNPRPYSRPVFGRTLTLRSEQRQRIMARDGDRALRSLHAIAVVFRAPLPVEVADRIRVARRIAAIESAVRLRPVSEGEPLASFRDVVIAQRVGEPEDISPVEEPTERVRANR